MKQQDTQKKLKKIIEKGKRSFLHKEEKRTFKELQKIEPQKMTIEEKFQFIEEAMTQSSIDSVESFSLVIDILDLVTDISSGTISNNHSSRKLNEIILRIQKEMK